MAKGYHTINQVINEALFNIKDFDRNRYKEAAMYFMSGYRDFKLHNAVNQTKNAWGTITSINTVKYPEDLVRLISVGCIINGEFFSFTRSEALVEPLTDPLDSTRDTDRNEDGTLSRTPQFGYGAKGANLEYYYKKDDKKRRIILSRLAVDQVLFADRGEVYLNYIANDIVDYDTTYMPDDTANLLISYIVYKLISSEPERYNNGYIGFKKEEYIEQLRMYQSLQMPSLQELEDMLYESSGQNVKRY